MNLFDYYESDSFLHRTHPLTKLAANLLVLIATTLYERPLAPFLLLMAHLLAGALLARLPLVRFIRAMRLFLVTAVIWVVFTTFLTRQESDIAHILFRLGPLTATEYGFWWGVTRALRMLCLIAFAVLLVATTEPTALILGLIQQGKLSYRLGYGILAGYRTVPLLQEEYDTIRAAHHVRGVPEGKGLSGALGRMKRYAIPLLAGAVRRGERAALAMDSRAFGAYPDRTYLRQMRFSGRDAVFLLGTIVFLCGLWALK